VSAVWDTTNSEWITDSSPAGNNYKWNLGAEVWVYVPPSILPHLKRLKENLSHNVHVYSVNLKPRIFDAKIFTPDDDPPYGWGTILVDAYRIGNPLYGVITDLEGNLKLSGQTGTTGGAFSDRDKIFFMTLAYFALDITNPEKPSELLWYFTMPKWNNFHWCHQPSIQPR
jgi:type IV pilus assembly protein PilY1